jgi:hypothetical protein
MGISENYMLHEEATCLGYLFGNLGIKGVCTVNSTSLHVQFDISDNVLDIRAVQSPKCI